MLPLVLARAFESKLKISFQIQNKLAYQSGKAFFSIIRDIEKNLGRVKHYLILFNTFNAELRSTFTSFYEIYG